jgi:hypothetical protein
MPRRIDLAPACNSQRLVRCGVALAAAGALSASAAPRDARGQDGAAAAAPFVTQWIDRTPAAKAPGPVGSEDASLIYDPVAGRVILYGGKDDHDLGSRETWAFDPASRAWERIQTKGPTPPASEDHTSIYDPNSHRMILYGGENGPTTNKLWSLDLKTFTWRELTNPQVPRREAHSADYDSLGKRMIVFGGLDRLNEDLYSVWAMDLDPASPAFEKWRELTVPEGRPPGRIDHAAVYDPIKNRLVFHGGWTKTRKGLYADTWAFYLPGASGAGRWARLDTGGVEPPPRRHAVGVHDPDRNLFVMFGGQGPAGHLNDVWAFDLTRDVWTNITPPTPGPMGRIDHQAVYDPRRKSLLVYGGDADLDDMKLHDIWELVLSPAPADSSTRGAQ